MKFIHRSAIALAMSSLLITQTGCFGTFALTKKTYQFHDGCTDSKFVKSLLYWIPGGLVYAVTLMLDSVIFNLIEFWSGSNPVSMNEGDHEMQLATIDGTDYRIEATKDTFTTTQLTGAKAGEVRIMRFDRSDMTWKYSDAEVCDLSVMTFLDDRAENVRVYTDNGTVDLSTDELADMDVLRTRFKGCGAEAMACAN
jgi:hypothetical protein